MRLRKKVNKKKSEASKKGWVTRRKNVKKTVRKAKKTAKKGRKIVRKVKKTRKKGLETVRKLQKRYKKHTEYYLNH